MACTVFTRLFHGANLFPRSHRSSSRAHTDPIRTDTNPSVPLSATLETAPALKREAAIMASEQSPRTYNSIQLFRVPSYLTPVQLENCFSTLPQLVQVRKSTATHRLGFCELILDFEPGDNVKGFLDIESSPIFTIDNHGLDYTSRPFAYAEDKYKVISTIVKQPSVPGAFEDDAHIHQLVKLDRAEFSPPTCYICFDDLADQQFSTPCLACHQSQCYACVKRQFLQTLTDFETFPARCCDVALHPDITKGILSDEDYKRYRARFEEWLSKDKLYCPVPTCSAFIPSRLRKRVDGNNLRCHACNTAICSQCKEIAHSSRSCAANTGKDELVAVLTKFGYKQCPRCKSGVAKMHGCNHVACKCGAHWCWDCKRKIDDCNADPCEDHPEGHPALYENDEEVDNESIIDSVDGREENQEQRTANQGQETTTTGAEGIATGEHLEASQSATDPVDTNTTAGSETNSHSVETSQQQPTTTEVIEAPETIPDQPEIPPQQPLDPLQGVGIGQPISEELQRLIAHHDAMFLDHRTLPNARPPSEDSTTDSSLFSLTRHPCQPSTTTPSSSTHNLNLDDPTVQAWEYQNLDFGEEPSEDDHMDVWGCQHTFLDFTRERIPRYWMTASDEHWWEREHREVACMRCWEPARIVPMAHLLVEMAEAEQKRWMKMARAATRCYRCAVVLCRRCKLESRNGNVF